MNPSCWLLRGYPPLLTQAHIAAAKQIYEYVNTIFGYCEFVKKNGFRVPLGRGYSLSIISPIDAMGNRDFELEADGLSVARLMETALLRNDELIYIDEWEYHDTRRWWTDRPHKIIKEIFRLRHLIDPSKLTETDPAVKEILRTHNLIEPTKPTETEATETKPTETGATETEPTETGATETEPTETEPTGTEPTGTEPAETGATDAGATDTGASGL